MNLLNGDVLSKADLRELGWDVKDTVEMEEFQPIVSFPVVMYHGSHRDMWGLFYGPATNGSTLYPINGPSTVTFYRPASVTETDLRYYPDTGEIR